MDSRKIGGVGLIAAMGLAAAAIHHWPEGSARLAPPAPPSSARAASPAGALPELADPANDPKSRPARTARVRHPARPASPTRAFEPEPLRRDESRDRLDPIRIEAEAAPLSARRVSGAFPLPEVPATPASLVDGRVEPDPGGLSSAFTATGAGLTAAFRKTGQALGMGFRRAF